MAKFENLLEAFWDIKENPLDYLPEKSLSLFESFWFGYTWRYESELEADSVFRLPDGFYDYVNNKYRTDSSHGAFNIISLYSRNEADAFESWFEHLSRFVIENNLTATNFYTCAEEKRQKADFFEFLKAIIKRPAMYVGSNSFTLVASIISGYLRVIEDFGFAETKEETVFKDFQKYIELKDINLPSPPWNKIIWFWSMSDSSALKLFAEYLDEFAFQGKGCIESIEYHWQRRLEARQDKKYNSKL